MIVGEIFGPDLLVVVVVVAVLILGGGAIPKFARNLGQAKSEFESGLRSAKIVHESPAAATALKASNTNE